MTRVTPEWIADQVTRLRKRAANREVQFALDRVEGLIGEDHVDVNVRISSAYRAINCGKTPWPRDSGAEKRTQPLAMPLRPARSSSASRCNSSILQAWGSKRSPASVKLTTLEERLNNLTPALSSRP